MVASQNGWRANDRSVIVSYPLPGGSIALRQGSPGLVLCHVLRRFHNEVEALVWPGIWGYAERPIRGGTELSNHASGTAGDANAPRHPLGTQPAANFAAWQIDKIHEILTECEGLIRWGGDYTGRKDGMHFEVNDGVTLEQLDALWAKLQAKYDGQVPAPAPTPIPAPRPAPSGFRAIQMGEPTELNTMGEQVRRDQADLIDTGFPCGNSGADGSAGGDTVAAIKAFQFAARITVDGVMGKQTRDAIHSVPSWHGGGLGGYPLNRWIDKLQAHGWRIADGSNYARFQSILRQFQADKGIPADGAPGPQSWTCLYCTVN